VGHQFLSRDPGGAELRAVLAALKDGIEATAVGVLDGARSWLHASSEASPGTFWAEFNGLHCLRPDWDSWEATLLATGRARVDCTCGRHVVQSFSVRGLWVVIVLATDALAAAAEEVVTQALPTIARLLPTAGAKPGPAAPVGGAGGSGGAGPAELGIPVWWIKKPPSDRS
jgi:hypothetical protein